MLRLAIERLRRLGESRRALAIGSAIFLAAAALFLGLALRTVHYTIRLTAGDARGRRAEIAEALAQVAEGHGVHVEIVASPGSEESLARVQRHELDAALVQGGLEPAQEVREIAPLGLEPVHLLVRPDRDLYELEDLRDARVNLSPPQSGTRRIALEILELAHLVPGRDLEETSFSYRELEEMPEADLPDAIFHVSALPSPVASFLVEQRSYRLLPLPMADAVALRDVATHRATIPAYAYGASPAAPPEDTTTVATRMILVAHRRTDEEVVRRLLETLDSEEFARAARLSFDDRDALFARPEMELHPGTVAWLHRNDPYFTSDWMQGVESLRSFLVSLIVAGFLLTRWWRRHRLHGLDAFLAEISRIDREVIALERSARLDLGRLVALRTALGDVKARGLSAFERGLVHSEELLSSFLIHAQDVRTHLDAMILHERERLEKTARSQGGDEDRALRQMWEEALAEEIDDRIHERKADERKADERKADERKADERKTDERRAERKKK